MPKVAPIKPKTRAVVPVPKSAIYGGILSGYSLPKPELKYGSTTEHEDKMGFRFYVSHTSTGRKLASPTSVYMRTNTKFSPPGKYQASNLFNFYNVMLSDVMSTEEVIQTMGQDIEINDLVSKPVMIEIELKKSKDGTQTYMNVKGLSECEDEVKERIREDLLSSAVFEIDAKTGVMYLKSPKPTYVDGDNDAEGEPGGSQFSANTKLDETEPTGEWTGDKLIPIGRHKELGHSYNHPEVDLEWLNWAINKKPEIAFDVNKELLRRDNAKASADGEPGGLFEPGFPVAGQDNDLDNEDTSELPF